MISTVPLVLGLVFAVQSADLLHSTPQQRAARVRALTMRPEGEAAWREYQRALAKLRPFYDALESADGPPVNRLDAPGPARVALQATWADADAESAARWIAMSAESLRGIRAATDRPQAAVPPKFEDGRFTDLDCDALWARRAAELLLIEAAQARMQGNIEAALDATRRVMRVAEHAYQQPWGFAQLTGMWVERAAHAHLLRLADRLAEKDVLKTIELLKQAGATRCRVESVLEIEALYDFEFYAACDAWARDRKAHRAFETSLEMWFPGISLTGTEPAFTMDQFQAALQGWTLERLWQARQTRVEHCSKWEARPFHERWRDVEVADAEGLRLAKLDPIGRLTIGAFAAMAPVVSGGAYGPALTRTGRNATATAIAVLDFRRAAKRLPKDLPELCRRYPKLEPTDHFTGAPLVYRSKPDGSWLLYSLGSDQTDDSGRHNGFAREPGDYVFWPVHELP